MFFTDDSELANPLPSPIQTRRVVAALCAPQVSRSLRSLTLMALEAITEDGENIELIKDVPCVGLLQLEELLLKEQWRLQQQKKTSRLYYSDESILAFANALRNIRNLRLEVICQVVSHIASSNTLSPLARVPAAHQSAPFTRHSPLHQHSCCLSCPHGPPIPSTATDNPHWAVHIRRSQIRGTIRTYPTTGSHIPEYRYCEVARSRSQTGIVGSPDGCMPASGGGVG
ncbi:hypothetical protein C8Q74DRAFT_1222496 [Fomes fomentarius]|nr:hypothetical protein C8Q74DRAFT_1222496 [Fomes fomentarius]